MKKITFLFIVLLGSMFSSRVAAQTLNQNAGWPNTDWTVTGTYNTTDPDSNIFEANPTEDANFAFDDDDAGNNSDDDIAAESPIIDLTSVVSSGETWLTVSGTYVYNWWAAGEKLAIQYYDADGSIWVDWHVFPSVDTPTAPTNNYCAGTASSFTTENLDISGFTATQQTGFRYRIYFNDNLAGAGYVYGFCFQPPTITSATPPTDTLDYYNVQWPGSGTISAGESFVVYAQAYEDGLTNTSSNPAVGIESWIGYSTDNTNPSGAGWNWVAAVPNPGYDFNQNNDEYMLDLGATITNTGTYYYASRWRLNGGEYTYGGFNSGAGDGVWDGTDDISGVLTINGPANDDCANATPLTPGIDYAANPVDGTVIGASDDGIDVGCGLQGPGVWYSVVVPADGNITIETGPDAATTTTTFDSVIEVFTGTCGSLTSIDCDDDGAETANFSLLELTGLDPLTTIYIRVWEYAGDETEPFSISAHSSTLGTSNFEGSNAFTYFPNPVKNTLKLNAQSNIQNVSIYNMLGQEVLKSTPNTMDSEIDMVSLQTGAYFVKVTINDVTETIRVIKQ